MTYVVTENCIQCKFTHCVNVCPVIAFHEGENFLVINPGECVNCGLCVDECEADAIFHEGKLPEEYSHFIQLNEELSQVLPVLLASKEPLPDAYEWLGRKNKLSMLRFNQ